MSKAMVRPERWVSFGAVLAIAASAWGQSVSQAYRASAGINQTLNTVTRGPGFSAFNAANRYGGYTPPPGGFGNSNMVNLQGPSFEIPAARNMRSGLDLYTMSTRSLDRVGNTPMLSLLGRSPTAYWFANPTYAAYGGVSPQLPPQYSDPVTAQLVHEPRLLAWKASLHHSIYDPELLKGGTYRDKLTTATMRNPRPVSQQDSAEPAQSPTERMEARLEAARTRYLDAGWDFLKQGRYLEARGAFDSAAMISSDDLTPIAGRLLCALADKEWKTAATCLERLTKLTRTWTNPEDSGAAALMSVLAGSTVQGRAQLDDDKPNLFALVYSPGEKYGSPKVTEDILAHFAKTVREDPNDEDIAALQVWMLWQNGQKSAALSAAEKLRSSFRSSQYARFAESIQEQMKEPIEGAAASAG